MNKLLSAIFMNLCAQMAHKIKPEFLTLNGLFKSFRFDPLISLAGQSTV